MADGLAGLPVLIYGGGELGTATALRLRQVGMRVLVVERPGATAVCRAISLAAAVYQDSVTVEGATGVRAEGILQAEDFLRQDRVPVMVSPTRPMLERFAPRALIDATSPRADPSAFPPDSAASTVRLGPGRLAPQEAFAAVDTSLTLGLGQVLYQGEPKPGLQPPGSFHPVQSVRAQASGIFVSEVVLGQAVEADQALGYVGPHEIEAPREGFVRGLLADGLTAHRGQAVAELWLGEDETGCFAVSPWARAVAGGALEAVARLLSEKGE